MGTGIGLFDHISTSQVMYSSCCLLFQLLYQLLYQLILIYISICINFYPACQIHLAPTNSTSESCGPHPREKPPPQFVCQGLVALLMEVLWPTAFTSYSAWDVHANLLGVFWCFFSPASWAMKKKAGQFGVTKGLYYPSIWMIIKYKPL